MATIASGAGSSAARSSFTASPQWSVTFGSAAIGASAASGNKTYGAPTAIAQLACAVELVRKVDPAVFKPRPRVDSAILRLRRIGAGADAPTRDLVRAAFAHRRKTLARSLEIAGLRGVPRPRAAARAGLAELGLPEDARAESLAPSQFAALSAILQRCSSTPPPS